MVEVGNSLSHGGHGRLSQHEERPDELVSAFHFQVLSGHVVQVTLLITELSLVLEQRPVNGVLEGYGLKKLPVFADVAPGFLETNFGGKICYDSAHDVFGS
jgi:hypothetical protein